MLNGELTLERAKQWASDLRAEHGEDLHALVAHACRAAWGRTATADEIILGESFIRKQTSRLRSPAGNKSDPRAGALADFCHAVMNANETLFVD
jgi:hypothetical protein